MAWSRCRSSHRNHPWPKFSPPLRRTRFAWRACRNCSKPSASSPPYARKPAWLDLYLLLRDHGFTLRDYRAAFVEAGAEAQCDTGLTRLCDGLPQRADEGYAHLLSQPPTLKEMTDFFIAQRNQLEVELAAEAMRRHNGNV